MTRSAVPRSGVALRSLMLLVAVPAIGGGLALWKRAAVRAEEAAAAQQPEQVETIQAVEARSVPYRATVTSIGTVIARRSITLRNEVPGTVARVNLTPGRIVERGEVLVALDVSVEEAQLKALEARAQLAESTLERLERMAEVRAVSAIEVDNARADLDVARADIERLKAEIARKVIRAPFRSRVGISDVHLGQFLEVGTVLTTLQGVDEAVYVDFAVSQDVAAQLDAGDTVDVVIGDEGGQAIAASLIAIDARIDPATRNATIRARIDDAPEALTPGASVRVRVPYGPSQDAVLVPASALRKGPSGDHIFVVETGESGETRARIRPVQVGPLLEQGAVVLSGLEAGEHVAASGSFKLRDSLRVTVVEGPAVASGGR